VVTTLAGPVAGTCAIDHNLTNAGSMFDNGSPCNVASNRTGADPKLVNVSAAPYDFHLRPESPAVAAGAPVANPAWDFDGVPRRAGSASDIGACELAGEARSR
jgi:hypothetical protein